ncbi:hypothetical protein FEZ63_12000 [Microvirga brassicacearum]|uniref:Uncharacterized protein n=1 Tax=Microvirga brassicacearum TaxID=2580413 RepID=A0A5N3PAP5_9HYPH|nr:hypothetical protein FEZ63_12000 [Microvirga brassicacearum]
MFATEPFEQRRDAFRLMPGIEDQAAKLAAGFQRLEPLQGGIDLATASAVQLKRAHDGADARQQVGWIGFRGLVQVSIDLVQNWLHRFLRNDARCAGVRNLVIRCSYSHNLFGARRALRR